MQLEMPWWDEVLTISGLFSDMRKIIICNRGRFSTHAGVAGCQEKEKKSKATFSSYIFYPSAPAHYKADAPPPKLHAKKKKLLSQENEGVIIKPKKYCFSFSIASDFPGFRKPWTLARSRSAIQRSHATNFSGEFFLRWWEMGGIGSLFNAHSFLPNDA